MSFLVFNHSLEFCCISPFSHIKNEQFIISSHRTDSIKGLDETIVLQLQLLANLLCTSDGS